MGKTDARPYTAGPNRQKWVHLTVTCPSKAIDTANLIAAWNSSYDERITDLAGLTNAIRNACSTHKAKIGHLTIYAHANPSGVYIGKDKLSLDTFETHRPALKSVAACFVRRVSHVHMVACQLGKNSELIRKLSTVWNGADVKAFLENQRAEDDFPIGSGAFVLCSMDDCKFVK